MEGMKRKISEMKYFSGKEIILLQFLTLTLTSLNVSPSVGCISSEREDPDSKTKSTVFNYTLVDKISTLK